MSKKMQKALLAFINEDVDQAKTLLRQVFLESAQKVNKELEESFEAESPEGEELDEAIDQDPESDLEGEVEYKLDEGWGDFEDPSQPVEEASEEPEGDDFPADEPSSEMGDTEEEPEVQGTVEVEAGVVKDIQTLVDELSEIFDSIQGEDDFSADGDEFGSEPQGDEFSDVPMGDEKFGESFKMKPVAAPEKSEKAGGNKKSPIAPNAKAAVDGVKPIQSKNGHVETSDKAFKNSDTESVKVEDNNNVMDSAKGMMKDVTVPKHTAEKGRSPLPKQK